HDKIVMVTAYDAPAARLADEAGVELILVGDTAAMVMLGHESTVPVTLDEMIFLTRAVSRSARRPLVIGDLPFGSYESSDAHAIPTIGIGAGAECDGQVLVWHDLLGMYPGSTPRFVKRYADLAGEIADALGHYASDVRAGAFPEERHTYSIPEDELARFEA